MNQVFLDPIYWDMWWEKLSYKDRFCPLKSIDKMWYFLSQNVFINHQNNNILFILKIQNTIVIH